MNSRKCILLFVKAVAFLDEIHAQRTKTTQMPQASAKSIKAEDQFAAAAPIGEKKRFSKNI